MKPSPISADSIPLPNKETVYPPAFAHLVDVVTGDSHKEFFKMSLYAQVKTRDVIYIDTMANK